MNHGGSEARSLARWVFNFDNNDLAQARDEITSTPAVSVKVESKNKASTLWVPPLGAPPPWELHSPGSSTTALGVPLLWEFHCPGSSTPLVLVGIERRGFFFGIYGALKWIEDIVFFSRRHTNRDSSRFFFKTKTSKKSLFFNEDIEPWCLFLKRRHRLKNEDIPTVIPIIFYKDIEKTC